MSELPTTGARLGANSWVASLAPWDESLSEAPGFQHTVTLNSGTGRVLRLHGLRRDTLPLYAHNDTCGVIFDGVLFERPALCAKLGLAGDLNLSDAELVLKSYQRDGESFLRQIRGLFAVVIWDSARNTCLWARDHLGVFPLYYAETGQSWLISTAIDILIKFPGVPSQINRLAVVNRLLHRWENETLWEDIERLLPGHAAQFDGKTLITYHYWDPVGPGKSIEWIEDGAQELFSKLTDQAVTRYLELGKAGIFLSGGLDSVSVAAIAADIAHQGKYPTPLALSLVFPGDADERHIQEGIARQLELPQVIAPLFEITDKNYFIQSVLEISRQRNWPVMNFWLPAYYVLTLEAQNRGCQIILTGAGGDEWLGVTPLLAADLILSFDFLNLFRLWKSLSRSYRLSSFHFTRNVFWYFGFRPIAKRAVGTTALKLAPSAFQGILQRRHQKSLPDWLPADPELREALKERVAQAAISSYELRGGSFYVEEVRAGLDHPLCSLEMEENFETTRQTGMPILGPYWDVDLVDMLFRTPPPVLNGGGRSKGLVRQSLARRFPKLGFERQRKVLAINQINSIIKEDSLPVWRSMGGPRTLAALGIVKEPVIEEVIQRAITDQSSISLFRIWDFLNLEAWTRSHT